ncbi:MAG: hypothetical protein SVT52_09440 [Planctomycetota bacterium]|nr:hypothetical protein [Planctomycetota bacterium]
MFDITLPPPPECGVALLLGLAAGAVLLGAVGLLAGLKVGRVFAALAGGGLGFLLIGQPARRLGTNALALQTAFGVAIGLLCLVVAKLIWALLAATLAASAAGVAAIGHLLPKVAQGDRPAFQFEGTTFTEWLAALWAFGCDAVTVVWRQNSPTLLMFICPAAMAVLITGLLRLRLATVFMTSLLGAAAIVAGLGLAGISLQPTLWDGLWRRWYIPVGAAAVAMLIGMVHQYRHALAEEKESVEVAPSNKREAAAETVGQNA